MCCLFLFRSASVWFHRILGRTLASCLVRFVCFSQKTSAHSAQMNFKVYDWLKRRSFSLQVSSQLCSILLLYRLHGKIKKLFLWVGIYLLFQITGICVLLFWKDILTVLQTAQQEHEWSSLKLTYHLMFRVYSHGASVFTSWIWKQVIYYLLLELNNGVTSWNQWCHKWFSRFMLFRRWCVGTIITRSTSGNLVQFTGASVVFASGLWRTHVDG